MKPAPFKYYDPRSIADATALLATHDNARVLAGGQSLMPMMNFRYAMPDHLIDLNQVEGLAGIRVENGRLCMGAMTRQRDIEFSNDVAAICPVLRAALAHVGHRQTRNRGTLGGSLCHLDPAAELVNIAALLDANLQLAARHGVRDVAFADFARGYMTTALEPEEMLTRATLRLPAAGSGYAFEEFARRHGDFAIVACSAVLTLNSRGAISSASLALSGLNFAPLRPTAIEQALIGQPASEDTFKAAAVAAEKLEATTDAYVTAAYRQHLARVLTFRALTRAAARAKE